MNHIVRMRFGSHVYGTALPTSDTDIKAVYIPDARNILLQRVKGSNNKSTKEDPNAKNNPEDVDTESFSLQEYLKLLCEGQTVALDMLFTPREFYLELPDPLWHFDIQCNRKHFLHRGTTSFVGYCMKQAAKYGLRGSRMGAVRKIIEFLDSLPEYDKLEQYWRALDDIAKGLEHVALILREDLRYENFLEVCNRKVGLTCTVKHAKMVFGKVFDAYGERSRQAEMNEGIDWKALMHAVRVLGQAKELLLTGNITFPRPEAEFLLQIRKGELSYKQVADVIEQGVSELEDIKEKSTLPDKPDYDYAEELVMRAYKEVVVNA